MDSWLADLGISASRFLPSRFPDWQILVFLLSRFLPHQISWQADLVNLLADLLTGRFGYFCQQIPPRQISWLADFGISAGRFTPSRFPDWQIWWICWQIWLFLLADFLPGKFPDWQILVFLLADSHPVSLSRVVGTILKLRVSMDNKSWLTPPLVSLTRVLGTILKLRVSMDNKRWLTPPPAENDHIFLWEWCSPWQAFHLWG